MHRLKLFLNWAYVLLIFLAMEGFAIYYYANSSANAKTRLMSASNKVVGVFYTGWLDVSQYYNLRKKNSEMVRRVADLEKELAYYREYYGDEKLASIRYGASAPHEYIVARVIRNSVSKAENYIIVDKGTDRPDNPESDKVMEKGMAVVSPDGCLVGYVEEASGRYAVCISALNKNFRTSGRIKGKEHFGSISWSYGKNDKRHLQLSEIPKYAEIERGDTIVTTGYSFYFPEDIMIGTVDSFRIDESKGWYDVEVLMGTDMSRLREVILVGNTEAQERFRLERETYGRADEM